MLLTFPELSDLKGLGKLWVAVFLVAPKPTGVATGASNLLVARPALHFSTWKPFEVLPVKALVFSR